MLHSSNASSRLAMGENEARSAVRQPRSFHDAEGVREAWPCDGPFSRTPEGRTAAQKAGLKYERDVHAFLSSTFADAYIASQWFSYLDRKGARRFCQPDGLLRLGSMVVIFEVKLRFTSDAWWQLRRLYSSVVVAAFKPRILGTCVITRSYDPAVAFPEAHELIDEVERWVIRRQFAQVGVLQWRP